MEHEVLVDDVCQELEKQYLVFKEQTESLSSFLLYASEKKLNQGDLSGGTFVINLIGMLCAMLNGTQAHWQRITICHSIIPSTCDKRLQTDVRPPHIPKHCAFLLSIRFVPHVSSLPGPQSC